MRSIRKSHVPTVSFRFERQIAEEGSRAATRTTAPRRGLRVAALGNPYRSGDAIHEKNTTIKQTETTALQITLCKRRFQRLRLPFPNNPSIPPSHYSQSQFLH
ncbi:hypothetical protein RCS94_07505 [Orbaceae bacterium ac157xtp]